MDLFGDWFNGLFDYFHHWIKYLAHLYFGTSEIERICSGQHNSLMTNDLSKSIRKSKKLEELNRIVSNYREFEVIKAQETIQTIKKIPNTKLLLLSNLKICLKQIRMMSIIYSELDKIKSTVFSYDNPEHVNSLDSLWNCLKPNIQRSEAKFSSEWGDLGFQGKDPSTDFRGMGFLGLDQLVYFSKTHKSQARKVLEISQTQAYFPFAATGINITAFVMELLRSHKLDRTIYSMMDEALLTDTLFHPNGFSANKICVDLCLHIVYEIYSKLYIQFGEVWLFEKPKDLMDFPEIFSRFKVRVSQDSM